MANVDLWIANPTAADVTVNSQVAVKGTLTKLTIADTTTDAYGFLAAGCAIVSNAITIDEACQGGFLISELRARQ